jgi:hypothetical protein
MSVPMAVTGVIWKYALTVDGGLRVTIELDENQKRRFHEFFPDDKAPVVLARLDLGSDSDDWSSP